MLPVAVSVIGLAFVIVKYKNCVNLAAVAATTVLSAAFTLASTLGVAHVLGVSPGELEGREPSDLHLLGSLCRTRSIV